jgi:cytochrome c oxidase subunit 2
MNERTEFWTDGGSLWLPPQHSTTAHEIDALFYFILYASTILTVGVAVGMVYLAWKYRRRSHADRPAPVKENKSLELAWSVIPTLLVMVVFFWGFRAYVGTSIPPTDAYTINVKGQKWFWTFEYPTGLNTDELVVPAGQPVKLVMTSQDVLHSFFVPEFRIKMDVIPNRYSYVWFNAPEPGVYQIVCTEYCGTGHSNMGAHVRVVGRDDFYEFLRTGGGDAGADLPPAEYGALLYEQKRCNTCHSVDGSPATGPTWLGAWGQPRPGSESGVFDDNYVRQSILEPGAYVAPGFQPQMPSYEGQLDDRAIQAVAAYIRQLNGAATPADLAPPGGEAAADSLGTGDAPESGAGDPSEPVGFEQTQNE